MQWSLDQEGSTEQDQTKQTQIAADGIIASKQAAGKYHIEVSTTNNWSVELFRRNV
jgi:hypothetical protein